MWRAHSDTLGFMPEGGFEDRAQRRQLIAACDGDKLCGYVMYRLSRDQATIAHLCVSSAYRRQGIAKALAGEVCKRTANCAGVGLRCRRDYDGNALWPRLNFVAMSECPGRGKTGERLTFWWYDHGHKNLLSTRGSTASLRAVIDANVFFDLLPNADVLRPESKALQADWLVGLIELCLTDEIFNEIERQNDAGLRDSSRAYAQSFTVLPARPGDYEAISRRLSTIINAGDSDSTRSDFKHIVRTIANEVPVFVTRDEGLLGNADVLLDEFGLRVIRPTQLIVEMDALCREEEYRPTRLAGTRCQVQRTANVDLSSWAAVFQNTQDGEKKQSFVELVTGILADPKSREAQLVSDVNGEPIALVAFDYSRAKQLHVPVFRVRRGPQAPTLARHLLFNAVKRSVGKGRVITRVTDSCLQVETQRALSQEFRRSTDGTWLKVNVPGVGSGADLLARLNSLAVEQGEPPEVINPYGRELASAGMLNDPAKVLELERAFWPFKLTDGALPAFIMAIRPEWAKHLVDHRLSADELFGADEQIAMNREAVYYRASRPGGPTAPARVLWYVSDEPQELRAASLVSDVEVGPAQDLFRKNQRYGVYRPHHIRELVEGDWTKEITAVRFLDTETFAKPIGFHTLTAVLRGMGINTQLLSPTAIPSAAYFKLYGLATGGEA